MGKIVLMYVEGKAFAGKLEAGVLKDAMEVQTTFMATAQGISPVSVNRKVGDLVLGERKYPYVEVKENTDVYRDYCKLVMNIVIPETKIN